MMQLQYEAQLENIPVRWYRSEKTGLSVVHAPIEGPLVHFNAIVVSEAHDDDGLPHTLEHLVFMGSENYPYKGVLDKLASRCYTQETNAYTATTNTVYFTSVAGRDGFLNLLPVFMDHILFPTITQSAFDTEVHHVDGEGNNSGVVYSEMQGREHEGNVMMFRRKNQLLYPGTNGYRVETGGMMENLRSLTREKVVNYHKKYYCPSNMCIVICGTVEPSDIWKALEPVENKIMSKQTFKELETRPFSVLPQTFDQTIDEEMEFPSAEEDVGEVTISWIGPRAMAFKERYAISTLMSYLTSNSTSPLQKELVNIEEPLASEVDFYCESFDPTCWTVYLEGVEVKNQSIIRDKVMDVLKDVAANFDKDRLRQMLAKKIRSLRSYLETSPEEWVADRAMMAFTFGNSQEEFNHAIDRISQYESLVAEPPSYFVELLRRYFVDARSVTVRGRPSTSFYEQLKETEAKRLKEQKEAMTDEQLKELGRRVEQAKSENEIETPSSIIDSVPIPNLANVTHISIRTHRTDGTRVDNEVWKAFVGGEKEEFPFALQLDSFRSHFVELTMFVDTSSLPQELRPYLPLYTASMWECPKYRDGKMLSHEDVHHEYTEYLDCYSIVLGHGGDDLECGLYSQYMEVAISMERKDFAMGVKMLAEALFKIEFDVERLKIEAKKLIANIGNYKRSDDSMMECLHKALHFKTGTNMATINPLLQQSVLEDIISSADSAEGVAKLQEKLKQIVSYCFHPENIRMQIATDVFALENGLKTVKEEFNMEGNMVNTVPPPVALDYTLRNLNIGLAWGLEMPIESYHFWRTGPGLKSSMDPELAALKVVCKYLSMKEGPLWNEVRGAGLAYGADISTDVNAGLVTFSAYRSTNPEDTYKKAKEVVQSFCDGKAKFDKSMIESAKSNLIYRELAKEDNVKNAAADSWFRYLRNNPTDYNTRRVMEIQSVTESDMAAVFTKYISQLFDHSCCNTTLVMPSGSSHSLPGITLDQKFDSTTAFTAFLKASSL